MDKADFILGVDLDGVCADYHQGFRKLVAAEHNVAVEALSTPTEWGYGAWGIDEAEFIRIHTKGVKQNMLAELAMFEGCAESLQRLSKQGVWIRIITHRIYASGIHSKTVSDTVKWLDQHKIPYRDICFLGAKPQVEADVYIDDAPHNIEALKQAGNDVIIFDQPYNKDFKGSRAENWDKVETIVVDLLNDRTATTEVTGSVSDADPA